MGSYSSEPGKLARKTLQAADTNVKSVDELNGSVAAVRFRGDVRR